ncbi:hypothetical protein RRG08_005861 [Elysia crispata]|uniref:Uncharacterized protein n=1 Tax=Elysia crispata TaxID=231223 RepID=A0AAE0YJR9_9GAST|nr:hypothetical protein RRG08_005861 [Elysia crispata]
MTTTNLNVPHCDCLGSRYKRMEKGGEFEWACGEQVALIEYIISSLFRGRKERIPLLFEYFRFKKKATFFAPAQIS